MLFPAGSSADVTARMLADGMSRHLGQRVLVVNRPGAGGAIGYKYVASQKPDGYSLVWNSNSISTTFHSGQLNFDYQAFDAVARVLSESVVVAVRRSNTERMPAGFDLGTISASRLEVNATGLPTSPSLKRRWAFSGAAEANRSAGAPFLICVSSAFEPAKLYRWARSKLLNASVSDEAA